MSQQEHADVVRINGPEHYYLAHLFEVNEIVLIGILEGLRDTENITPQQHLCYYIRAGKASKFLLPFGSLLHNHFTSGWLW